MRLKWTVTQTKRLLRHLMDNPEAAVPRLEIRDGVNHHQQWWWAFGWLKTKYHFECALVFVFVVGHMAAHYVWHPPSCIREPFSSSVAPTLSRDNYIELCDHGTTMRLVGDCHHSVIALSPA